MGYLSCTYLAAKKNRNREQRTNWEEIVRLPSSLDEVGAALGDSVDGRLGMRRGDIGLWTPAEKKTKGVENEAEAEVVRCGETHEYRGVNHSETLHAFDSEIRVHNAFAAVERRHGGGSNRTIEG